MHWHSFALLKKDGRLTKSSGKAWPKTRRSSDKVGIYAILHEGVIIRFGETATGLRRVKRGFCQKGRIVREGKSQKNYYAYSFRTSYKGKRLDVCFFPSLHGLLDDARRRRGVEAELAYQYRRRSGQDMWPEAMTEIHFLNGMSPAERSFADFVLKQTGTRRAASLSRYRARGSL
jgi:hypothetical protein